MGDALLLFETDVQVADVKQMMICCRGQYISLYRAFSDNVVSENEGFRCRVSGFRISRLAFPV